MYLYCFRIKENALSVDSFLCARDAGEREREQEQVSSPRDRIVIIKFFFKWEFLLWTFWSGMMSDTFGKNYDLDTLFENILCGTT